MTLVDTADRMARPLGPDDDILWLDGDVRRYPPRTILRLCRADVLTIDGCEVGPGGPIGFQSLASGQYQHLAAAIETGEVAHGGRGGATVGGVGGIFAAATQHNYR